MARYRGSIYFDINADTREEALEKLFAISLHLHDPILNSLPLEGVQHYVGNVATIYEILTGKDAI